MPRKQAGGNAVIEVALDRYGIYRVPSLARVEHCPESVYKTFELVHDMKILQMNHSSARAP